MFRVFLLLGNITSKDVQVDSMNEKKFGFSRVIRCFAQKNRLKIIEILRKSQALYSNLFSTYSVDRHWRLGWYIPFNHCGPIIPNCVFWLICKFFIVKKVMHIWIKTMKKYYISTKTSLIVHTVCKNVYCKSLKCIPSSFLLTSPAWSFEFLVLWLIGS